MILEEQIKIIFLSFIYGILFYSGYKLLKHIKIKKRITRYVIELIFCVMNSLLFYYLIYKINGGILSYYIFIFVIIGNLFCHLLYFNEKKDF